MFFHVDESGNTGNNLFDFDQRRLSYGVISSTMNVDALCNKIYQQIQDKIECDLIHANELGMEGLRKIAPQLIEIQKKMKFDFDYYFIDKTTFALVVFFDAVFDAGLNDAVRWDIYWTPMRYVVIHKLTVLFDEQLLKEAWRLCTERRIERCQKDIINLLTEVKNRAEASHLDERSKEIIIDALNFGIAQPLSLDFGFPKKNLISPNAVGFQFVVASIARRMRKKKRKKAFSIVIDRQAQFNQAQIGTHYNLSRIAEWIKGLPLTEKNYYLKHPLFVNFDSDEIAYKGLPDRELTIAKSSDSIGLQMVDVYLWIANKIFSGSTLPDELIKLWEMLRTRSIIDGISLEGMARRFMQFEATLPEFEELTDEQLELARKSIEFHRAKVRSLT